MLHFIQNFIYYMMFEVIEPRYQALESQLRRVLTVDEVSSVLHIETQDCSVCRPVECRRIAVHYVFTFSPGENETVLRNVLRDFFLSQNFFLFPLSLPPPPPATPPPLALLSFQVLICHTEFQDTCLKECLLTNQDLLKVLTKLMTTCLLFGEQEAKFLSSVAIDEKHMGEAVTSMSSTDKKEKRDKRDKKDGKRGSKQSGRAPNMELRRTRIRVQSNHIRQVASQADYKRMITQFGQNFDVRLREFLKMLLERSQYDFHASLVTRLNYNSFYQINT